MVVLKKGISREIVPDRWKRKSLSLLCFLLAKSGRCACVYVCLCRELWSLVVCGQIFGVWKTAESYFEVLMLC